MASTQVVEMSVTNNSPSQDSNHPDDLFQSRKSILYITGKTSTHIGLALAESIIITIIIIIIITTTTQSNLYKAATLHLTDSCQILKNRSPHLLKI